jgi:peptide/nickel transport system ATP-binding protein
MTKQEAWAEGEAMLARVGIRVPAAMMRRYPHEASGGEKQRVGIATAFACQPELILFDEPTTALDVITARQILDLFAELQAETHVASLYISHDLAVVSAIANRVAVIHRGRIVEQGPIRDVFASPRDPYTRMLLDAVPRPDHRIVTTQPEAAGRPSARRREDRRRVRAQVVPVFAAGARTGALHRQSRGEPDDPSGRDPRHRRRIRFGQVDAGEGADRTQSVHRRDPLSAAARSTPRAMDRAYRRDGADHFPEPDSSLNPRQRVREILSRPLALYGQERDGASATSSPRCSNRCGCRPASPIASRTSSPAAKSSAWRSPRVRVESEAGDLRRDHVVARTCRCRQPSSPCWSICNSGMARAICSSRTT